MPPLPPARPRGKSVLDKKQGSGAVPAAPKKEPPKELCGCGVDTYRPPPKGKARRKPPAPVVHAAGCVFQRTTCENYPHLPLCEVCASPCRFCLGRERWCPHCYERPCAHRYRRVVHGREAAPDKMKNP